MSDFHLFAPETSESEPLESHRRHLTRLTSSTCSSWCSVLPVPAVTFPRGGPQIRHSRVHPSAEPPLDWGSLSCCHSNDRPCPGDSQKRTPSAIQHSFRARNTTYASIIFLTKQRRDLLELIDEFFGSSNSKTKKNENNKEKNGKRSSFT